MLRVRSVSRGAVWASAGVQGAWSKEAAGLYQLPCVPAFVFYACAGSFLGCVRGGCAAPCVCEAALRPRVCGGPAFAVVVHDGKAERTRRSFPGSLDR